MLRHLGKGIIGDKDDRGFDEDSITVNPILSLLIIPFIDVCKQEKKGLSFL